jgi:LacI family transcriptional regulator
VRLREIAEMAGVSASTVSRVINNDRRISAETKERVLRVVRKAGYRMNAVARGLKTRRTHSVGLVVPRLAEEFFMRIAHGVEDELRKRGYSVLICNANENIARERDRIELLLEKKVDGMIIIPCSGEGSHFRVIRKSGIPVVIVDRLVGDFKADTVVVDNFEGTRRAVGAIIRAGYTRVGLIGADNAISTARERYRGYLQALMDHGMRLDRTIVKFGDFSMESGYRSMESIMTTKLPPDHVFIINYYMSLGAARCLAEEDASRQGHPDISTFDELGSARLFAPVVYTVTQPVVDIGTEAAKILLRRMVDGDRSGLKTVVLNTSLVGDDI